MRVLAISDYRDTRALKPEAELMLGLKKAGIDVDIITFPDTAYEKDFTSAGIKVYHKHPAKKIDNDFVIFLRRITIENKYDIFYLFNSQAIINGIRAAKKLSVKVVLYRGYTGNIHWYDPTSYFKYLHPRVDKVVCLASSIEQLLCRQLFFKKEKAITINKGHHPDWYKGHKPLDLRKFGIPDTAFVVASMANARPFKGIKYLLQATYLLEQLPHLHLLLIGRDMNKGPLQKLIDDSPMNDRIHVTGWQKDVLNILASCHVVALASVGGEATTKSLIEAMSMGLAPVITDIDGNKGMVIHQKNGLVVPIKNPQSIADALTFYYKNQSIAVQHGQLAKAHIAKHFHTDRTVKETIEMFNELLTTNH